MDNRTVIVVCVFFMAMYASLEASSCSDAKRYEQCVKYHTPKECK